MGATFGVGEDVSLFVCRGRCFVGEDICLSESGGKCFEKNTLTVQLFLHVHFNSLMVFKATIF